MRLALITALLLFCSASMSQAQDIKDTRGSPLDMGEVFFTPGGIQPIPQRHDEIKRLANGINTLLEYYGDGLVVVVGHTDSRGGNTYNLNLGESRAAIVRGLLVKEGVALSRVRIATHGENKPQASNRTRKGRAKNRRVLVYFVK